MLSIHLDAEALSEHPERVAVRVARAFFRELRRYDFTDGQVVRVASELIDCLSKSLEGYKSKIAHEDGEE